MASAQRRIPRYRSRRRRSSRRKRRKFLKKLLPWARSTASTKKKSERERDTTRAQSTADVTNSQHLRSGRIFLAFFVPRDNAGARLRYYYSKIAIFIKKISHTIAYRSHNPRLLSVLDCLSLKTTTECECPVSRLRPPGIVSYVPSSPYTIQAHWTSVN